MPESRLMVEKFVIYKKYRLFKIIVVTLIFISSFWLLFDELHEINDNCVFNDYVSNIL